MPSVTFIGPDKWVASGAIKLDGVKVVEHRVTLDNWSIPRIGDRIEYSEEITGVVQSVTRTLEEFSKQLLVKAHDQTIDVTE